MKRIILTLLALSLISLLSACDNQDTLRIYNWGEYMDEDILREFTRETGIRVSYSTYASNEEMYARLKGGGSTFDLIFPSDYMIERMINEDMLEQIDMNNIPNYQYIGESFRDLSYDPTNQFSVPYMWGTLGIVYNKAMVDEDVDSWGILWDEKYAGQIIMYNSIRDSFVPPLRLLGFSFNTRSVEELQQARDLLIEQKPLVHAYMGDTVRDSMIGNEAALALMYSGDAVYCMEENEVLAYSVPKEGSNIWFDAMAIPKGARNKDKAEAFIDFLCRPDIALRNTEYIGFSTVNMGALQMLPEELLANPAYWPTDDIIERCEIFLDLGDFAREFDRAWTMILAR
ncbi:MAG: spermidine/putrescine ABC transporter substrate-binding protein [Lachnospiraceae bacterium]|jgi:spermidine/putrescine transport system substrate-binding protein|nr:spermidine/putrescine ABC transporter substrate-binding protein [Lachnospiraceae bacterium]